LTGCGGGGGATDTAPTQAPETYKYLKVNLPDKAGPHDAGFLLAHQLGYFPPTKLHVWFIAPSHPARPPMYVEEELVDAAIVHEPQLIQARDDGRPLVAFGSLVPHPTMAMIWLKGSGIDSVADLKGKTIAYPGIRFQKDFLEDALERAGLTPGDVKIKSVSYYLESELIHHRADAIFGGSAYIEGKLLEAHGLEPVVTPARKLGIPDYDELVLITRRDRYAEDPRSFQSLTEATTRGGMTVADRPGAATKAIVHQKEYEDSARPNLPIHRKTIRAGVEEIAPRFSHTGEINRVKLQRLVDWMYARGMIKRKWQASELLAGP